MALFNFGKPKPSPDKMLVDLIEHNADQIVATEGKTRDEATYLSICLVLDDLKTRPNGAAGHKAIMDMLLMGQYQKHTNDVLTYLAWSSGEIKLKPEYEAALIKRHQK